MNDSVNHDEASRRSREVEFHDEAALHISPDELQAGTLFESPTAMAHRFILHRMGNLHGLNILDVGTGTGEAAIYFAKQGAEVSICDISSGMVDVAIKSGRMHGVELKGQVCPAEHLAFPDSTFDFVYLGGVLHHVSNRPAAYEEIARVLRPQGHFYAVDPLAGNPIINIYRRIADQVRSPDETPLTLSELRLLKKHFRQVGHREFWLTTLALFLKYYVLDRVNPNEEHYWKKIYNETNRSLWWWWPLRGIDAILTRLPLLRNWCWHVVFWGKCPSR